LTGVVDRLVRGWRAHTPSARARLGVVIALTIAGAVAALFAPAALWWRLLRMAIDGVFLVALAFMVATPSMLERPAVRASVVGTIFSVLFAVFVLYGLVTMPHASVALVFWRIATSVALVVVLTSGLRKAIVETPSLRRLVVLMVLMELVASATAVAVDFPAGLHSVDVAESVAGNTLLRPGGVAVPFGIAAMVAPMSRGFVTTRDGRLFGTEDLATLLRATNGRMMLGMIDAAKYFSLNNTRIQNVCAYWHSMEVPLDGYPSAREADVVLAKSERCLDNLAPAERAAALAAFADGLAREATQDERDAAARDCGSVREGLIYGALGYVAGPVVTQGLADQSQGTALTACPAYAQRFAPKP
jgi:hypothetical protein